MCKTEVTQQTGNIMEIFYIFISLSTYIYTVYTSKGTSVYSGKVKFECAAKHLVIYKKLIKMRKKIHTFHFHLYTQKMTEVLVNTITFHGVSVTAGLFCFFYKLTDIVFLQPLSQILTIQQVLCLKWSDVFTLI